IDETTKALEEMPAFDSILQELQTKRTRLDKRELTIALFGAFSAGKYSFSNALFGEKILPVSPNPSTAVISRISPVTSEQKHRTVVITYKDYTILTEDITFNTRDLEIEDDNLNYLVD